MSGVPQSITKRSRTAAEERRQKAKRVGSLADFFKGSPLRISGLKLPRRKEPAETNSKPFRALSGIRTPDL
jgi:hypothetical protein